MHREFAFPDANVQKTLLLLFAILLTLLEILSLTGLTYLKFRQRIIIQIRKIAILII